MHSYPTPRHIVRPEPMGPHMLKLHLDPGRVLHRFTAPDTGDPHDHPFGFTSHVLSGGYVEDVFKPQPDGTHTVNRYQRLPGTSHRVDARTIHRLVELLAPEAWTLIEPGPAEQKSGFYRFDGAGIWHRHWDEPEFRLRFPLL